MGLIKRNEGSLLNSGYSMLNLRHCFFEIDNFKRAISVTLLMISFSSYADPHYVQALHPYWHNDELYLRYLKAFEDTVNVDIAKYDGIKDPDYGKNMFIYVYVINTQGADNFSLDISCPDVPAYPVSGVGHQAPQSRIAKIQGVASDPVSKNPNATIIDENKISWDLNPRSGRQGMWFYSPSPPTKRKYEIKISNSLGKSTITNGQISGPSCKSESSAVILEPNTKVRDRLRSPIKPEPLKRSEYERYVEGLARKNNCEEILGIHAKDQASGGIMYEVSCVTKVLLFECYFGERPICFLI